MAQQILIIAKENSLQAKLAQHLRHEGFGVSTTDQAETAEALLAGGAIQLVLLGLEELKRDGIAMLRAIRERFPRIHVITINAGDQLDLSIEAMRLGAYDDFLIPFDLDGLTECIRKALEKTNSRPRKEKR
jgi:DNA-binding NtrC family response regulator